MGKQVYSDEFKGAAVKQVVVRRHTMSSFAKRLGVNYHTLRAWVQHAKAASARARRERAAPHGARHSKEATAYSAALDAKEGRP
jgi:transposase-like protein